MNYHSYSGMKMVLNDGKSVDIKDFSVTEDFESGNKTIALNTQYDVDFSEFTITRLKNLLGYGDVIQKCSFCGQWGAVKTSCKHCGSPIDPQ